MNHIFLKKAIQAVKKYDPLVDNVLLFSFWQKLNLFLIEIGLPSMDAAHLRKFADNKYELVNTF